ncbi:hypothetical protein GW17_00047255 [Ensete ventricosum]|nr:hypothetical protein GW17_00047255 [Ensete ventricosum]
MARPRPRPPIKRVIRGKVACNATLVKGAGCRAPGRGCRPRPALRLAGAATPAVGVAAPWQGVCQRARAVATCVATTPTTQRGKEGLGHPLEKG